MRRGMFLLEKLVIVESPNKVIKIEGLLSDPKVVPDWSFDLPHLKAMGVGPEKAIAMATTGHFMSLKELTWTPQQVEGKPDDQDFPPNGVMANFALEWEVLPGRNIQDTVSHYIREKADNLTEIIIATDPDREGELIAIHALSLIKSMFPDLAVPFTRAYVHSITADGIRTAMQQRQEAFDCNLANAAEARHAMDRVFGFLGSSVVRFANPQMRSIGRVQTPALILVAERERRIASFLEAHKATFQIRASCAFLARHGSASYSQLVTLQAKDGSAALDWASEKDVKQLSSQWRLDQATGFSLPRPPVVTPNETEPPEPFTMATLIAKANRQLHLSSEHVSSCLQDLFQMGHITYPRTDSTRVDETALPAIYAAVDKEFGRAAVCRVEDRAAGKRRGGKKAAAKEDGAAEGNVEDAHEAIRPTDIAVKSADLGNIAGNTKLVYDLVRRNILAAYMHPMKTERVVAEVAVTAANGDEVVFTLEGRHTVTPGWALAFRTGSGKGAQSLAESQMDAEAAEGGGDALAPRVTEDEFNAIAGLEATVGRGLKLGASQVLQYRPSPPLPYSEGGLIEELKNNGVGRPSTYPMIVKTLLSRNYITVEKGRCETTEVGRMLVETSKTTFPSIVDIGFTSAFEKKLDRIAKPEASDNAFLRSHPVVTEGDYVLSSFVSKFLNYVTEATRNQRGNIAERSLAHKSEGGAALGDEEISRERQRAAATVPDLLDNSRKYRTFTALQNSLNDYLRRNFPPSPGALLAGGWAGRKPSSAAKSTSFMQYSKKKTTAFPARRKASPAKRATKAKAK